MNHDFRDNLVTPATTILTTLKIIDSHGVPIGLVHEDGRLVGTVTDGDIRRGILKGIGLDAPITKVMNAHPITAPAGISDAAVLALMQSRAILYIPIVDEAGRLVDLKSLRDLQLTADAKNPVVLMAGGQGTRLRPLTEDRPKPMIDVGGKPILETIVERFVEQGFTRIYISVNYRREMIEHYFGDGSKWGAHIAYIHEDVPRGTAGALALLPDRPERPMIVMNADLLVKINFDHLVKYHEEQQAAATMSVREYRFTVPYGVVEADGHTLMGVTEKPEHKFFVNAGIYVIGPDALDLVPGDRPFDMPELFAALLARSRTGAGGRPVVFPLREYWIDIGRLDDLSQAQREYGHIFSE